MRETYRIGLGVLGLLLCAGCRTATRVTEVPRVDLDLTGGNRGYLVGTPPEVAGPQRTTRQMVHTDVEIPSLYRPTRGKRSAFPGEILPPESETPSSEAASPEASGPAVYDVYVVQKGDSLWSIAAKPEIYGKATRWKRIFDANRELLKRPEHVRPGMRLKIPRDAGTKSGTTYGDEGTTLKK